MRQFQDAERKISEERGDFILFGLFERSDIFGKYDVVVSAPWLKDELGSAGLITDLVIAAVGNTTRWPKIGRFDAVPKNGPFLEALQEVLPDDTVHHGLKRVTNIYYEGNIIPGAMIITAAKYPAENVATKNRKAETAAV